MNGIHGKKAIVRLAMASAVTLGLLGGFGIAPAAAAHVECGDVITADTVLDSDVGPCAEGISVTVDNITLDLNGFTVFGNSGSVGEGAGIELAGVTGVVVTGGAVTDFDTGILITQGLANEVVDMELRDNLGSAAAGGDGVLIDSSSDNVIRDSQLVNNGPYDAIGVIVSGTTGVSNGNRIENNLILDNNFGFSPTNNQNISIRLEPRSTGATVEGNLIEGSGLDGIQVFGQSSGNVVRSNVVNNNGAQGVPAIRFGNGILVAGTGNLVEDNQADGNFASGIAISGNGNTIEDNSATGNAIAPLIAGRTTFDLKDFRPDCGTNMWRGNVFVTADPECTTR